MIGVFRQKSPANIILLLLLAVLIKLPVFLHPHTPVPAAGDGVLYKGLLRLLAGTGKQSPVIYSLLTFSILVIQALIFNRVVNHYRLLPRPNFLPGLAFLLVTSLLPEWNRLSAALVVSPVLVLQLSIMLRIHNEPRAAGIVFNMGLYTGLASLFYFPAAVFVIWCLFGLLIMRPLRLNEWVLCMLGVTAPYYFYAAWLFLAGQWDIHQLFPGLSFRLPAFQRSVWLAGSVLLLAIPFLAGGYYIQDNLRRMLIQVRKGWSLILLWLLFALLVAFLNSSTGFTTWVLAAIPFAGFHACAWYYLQPKWLAVLLFWIMIAFIIVFQYYQHGWG